VRVVVRRVCKRLEPKDLRGALATDIPICKFWQVLRDRGRVVGEAIIPSMSGLVAVIRPH
jgi:hypothetical protein